jgi:hypothetical protein
VFFAGIMAVSAGWAEPTWLPGGEEVRQAVASRQGKTELSRLAASMKPGTWAELKCGGPAGLRSAPQPSKGLDIGTWSDDGEWDSRTGQFLFLGLRQTRRFIAFSEEKNEWRDIGLPEDHEASNSPPVASKFGHQYSRNALDSDNSHYYTLAGNIHRYDLAAGRWSKLPPGGSYGGTGVLEFFAARKGLLALTGDHPHDLRIFSVEKQAWQSLGKIAVHGYHSMGRHNPFRQEVLFTGGNATIRTVARVNKDGTIERLKDAPEDMKITGTFITVDPLSGKYLVLTWANGRKLLDFDSDKNEWRLVDDFTTTPWPFENYGAPVVAYIPEYGVSMWISRKTFLYKHDASRNYPEAVATPQAKDGKQ